MDYDDAITNVLCVRGFTLRFTSLPLTDDEKASLREHITVALPGALERLNARFARLHAEASATVRSSSPVLSRSATFGLIAMDRLILELLVEGLVAQRFAFPQA